MGSTTIYLDDETLEIIKQRKRSDSMFNLSGLIQAVVKNDNAEKLTEEGLLAEINSKKSKVYEYQKEIEVLEMRLSKLRQKLEAERANYKHNAERREELEKINEFVETMTIEQHEERKRLKLSVMDYARRFIK